MWLKAAETQRKWTLCQDASHTATVYIYRTVYELTQNVQTSSLSLQQISEVVQISHRTGFAQEVHRVVGFEEGGHCKTVVECQITICVSLRLEQKKSCSVSNGCILESKADCLWVRTITPHQHQSKLCADSYSGNYRKSWESQVWHSSCD